MTMRTHCAGPATGGAGSPVIRRLRRAFLAAKLALGERMYAAGIDDGRLAAQIASVDRGILRAETARLSAGPLFNQRRELLLRLAAAALEDDAPLPGADAEYERLRSALTALRQEEARVATATPQPVAVRI